MKPTVDVSEGRVRRNAATINYWPRVVCYLLGALILGTITEHPLPEMQWTVFAVMLFWPHLAHWLGNKTGGDRRSEAINILVDWFLSGILATALAFRLWPTIANVVVCLINALLFGGGQLALRGIALFGLSAFFAVLAFDIPLHPDSERIPTLIGIGIIVAYVAFSGATGYRLRQRQRETRFALENEERRSHQLLVNVFPQSIVARLKAGESPIADQFADVTVLFVDIVGYTPISERLGPKKTVMLLNDLYRRFDQAAAKFGVEKIETAGDGYLAVGGAPGPLDNHPEAVTELALAMLEASRQVALSESEHVQIRIGLHTGPVFGGVVGEHRFHYTIFGETVNVASRIQSQSRPGRILVSESTCKRIRGTYSLEDCGSLDLKGHGPMRAYWVLESPSTCQSNNGLQGGAPKAARA